MKWTTKFWKWLTNDEVKEVERQLRYFSALDYFETYAEWCDKMILDRAEEETAQNGGTRMKWTKELPKEDGWYWRKMNCGCIDMIEVSTSKVGSNISKLRSYECMGLDTSLKLENLDYECVYGPIEPPKFDKNTII